MIMKEILARAQPDEYRFNNNPILDGDMRGDKQFWRENFTGLTLKNASHLPVVVRGCRSIIINDECVNQ